MEIGRREILAGSAAAILAATPLGRAGAATNALATILSNDGSSLEVVHVTAPVGAPSRIALSDEPGEKLAGTPLVQFLGRKADKVAIFSCPPGHKTPERAAARGGELLYVIQGAVTVKAIMGRRGCERGTMILCEEGGSFSLEAGPQGYTAIKIKARGIGAIMANGSMAKDGKPVHGVRIWTDKDGQTHVGSFDYPGIPAAGVTNSIVPEGATVYFEGPAINVAVRRFPRHFTSGYHNMPPQQRELVFMIDGIAAGVGKDGSSYLVKPGEMILFEDPTGGGHTLHDEGGEGFTELVVAMPLPE